MTLPLGIHFGLPMEQYLADPGLGSTQVKALDFDPMEYWWNSAMNPLADLRDDKPTAQQDLGTALHKIILEGSDRFDECYAVGPRKSDHDGLLVTGSDLSEWLERRGHAKSGSKRDLIARARGAGCDLPIWDEIIEAHNEHCASTGRESIDADTGLDIRFRAEVIEKMPNVGEYVRGGYSEVSIFWESRDVRWKARCDYVRTKDQADLKTFSNPAMEPIKVVVGKKIAGYRGHVQARLHWQGVQAAKEMMLEQGSKVVFTHDCEPPPSSWLRDFAGSGPGEFRWIFLQAQGAPIAVALKAQISTPRNQSDVWSNAGLCIDYARQVYLEYSGKMLPGEAWVNVKPETEMTDHDFPPWIIRG